MHDPTAADILLERLLQLAERLQTENAAFIDRPEQEQLWYNRGYANGMLIALQELGYGGQLAGRVQADRADLLEGYEALAWGRAYRHGEEMGSREAREVLAPRRAD